MTPSEQFFFQNYTLDASERIVPKVPNSGFWRPWKAGTKNGYQMIEVEHGGKNIRAKEHRIKFLLAHGYAPKIIDHIDENKLNNALSNLQEVEHSANVYKSRPRVRGSSIYRGVSWNKQTKRFRASIYVKGHMHYLGSFECEVLAAMAYDFAAIEYFGQWAKTNIVPNHLAHNYYTFIPRKVA